MDPTHATGSSRPEASATGSETVQSPYDAVLLAELTQKFGSVEKAKEVYALFSASMMTSAAAAPPPTIHVDSTVQIAIPHNERPQTSTRVPDSGFQQADPALNTSPLEAEREEATGELAANGGPNDGDKNVESEGRESENPNFEGEKEGETPVREEVVEGETPVLEMFAEGETPMETGDVTQRDFRGTTPEPVEEGATPSNVRGETPVYIEGGTPLVDDMGETP